MIEKITIVGGGSAGWMSAATMQRAFPNKEICVIESKDISIIGVGESTLGGIRRWAKYIGLEEKSFFAHTNASYKLSIKFVDFYKKNGGEFHYPFGQPFLNNENINPATYWQFKKYLNKEISNEDFVRCFFPSSALFDSNKFSLNEYGQFDNFNPDLDVAYHFDATKFGAWLRDEHCKPRGVKHIVGTVVTVNTNDNGISSLILDDGTEVTSDLYIDCTGWRSLLLGEALKEPFVSYSDMLPNNRAWATQINYKEKEKELQAYTSCTAIENGWVWNVPLWSRLGTGYVYSDKFVTPEEAKQQFKNHLMSSKMVVPKTKEEVDALEFRDLPFRVGIHERTFVKNVVAFGQAAGFLEPLESNGLFLVHEFLLKLVDILQRGDMSQFDKDMYNVSVKEMFDNFAKFVALHYALSHRDDTEYWKTIKAKSFCGLDGDPYFPYYGRTGTFFDVTDRYMNNWQHTIKSGYVNYGIVYVMIGMNLHMMNDFRYSELNYHGLIPNDLDKKIKLWEANKEKWKKNAEVSSSICEYLHKNFYS